MQLIEKGSTEGKWFEYVENAKPLDRPEDRVASRDGQEPNACFKVRIVPAAFDQERYAHYFGYKMEIRRRRGEVVNEGDWEKQRRYQVDIAAFALVDAVDAEIPGNFLKGTKLEADAEVMVKLDGQLADEAVRRALLAEVVDLRTWIIGRSNSLRRSAAEEGAELGKTS